MRTFLTAFLALAVSLLALNQGLGQTRLANAAGVDSLVVNSVSCAGAGKVDATISWTTLNQGPQYVNWSLENNGFQPGTYTTSAPLPASTSSAILQGLPSTNAIYLTINTMVGSRIEPGLVIVFSTAGYCQGMSQPYYPMSPFHGMFSGYPYPNLGFDQSLLAHACYLQSGPPFHNFDFLYDGSFDDEDDDEDDEDEDEEDEFDDDEEDELDEDEEDEGDEDEDDEDDEDDFIFRGGQANPCAFLFGHGGNIVNWGTTY